MSENCMMRSTTGAVLLVLWAALPPALAQAPTPGHKCVYNCDPAPSSSAPAGYGAAMGSAFGAAIVRSLSNQQQQQQNQAGPPPDNGQSRAARQSLDDWASGGSGRSEYPAPSAPTLRTDSAASQLEQWANEVSTQAARAAATVPQECVASGQIFDRQGKVIGDFYQCWPSGKDKYCLQGLANSPLEEVPCNTSSR